MRFSNRTDCLGNKRNSPILRKSCSKKKREECFVHPSLPLLFDSLSLRLLTARLDFSSPRMQHEFGIPVREFTPLEHEVQSRLECHALIVIRRHIPIIRVPSVLFINNLRHPLERFGYLCLRNDSVMQPIRNVLTRNSQRCPIFHQADVVNIGVSSSSRYLDPPIGRRIPKCLVRCYPTHAEFHRAATLDPSTTAVSADPSNWRAVLRTILLSSFQRQLGDSASHAALRLSEMAPTPLSHLPRGDSSSFRPFLPSGQVSSTSPSQSVQCRVKRFQSRYQRSNPHRQASTARRGSPSSESRVPLPCSYGFHRQSYPKIRC